LKISAPIEGKELNTSPQREIDGEKQLWMVETVLAQPPMNADEQSWQRTAGISGGGQTLGR
jgi:hypothetical protein